MKCKRVTCVRLSRGCDCDHVAASPRSSPAFACAEDSVAFYARERGDHLPNPVPMLLFCPACRLQHIDDAQPEKNWTNPPHRSHQCQRCGYVWRPADVATCGVAKLNTRGQNDGDARPQKDHA